MLPTFIGIGAPKSGTTWIAKCLGEHPEIYIPSLKETCFFDYLYDQLSIQEYEAYFDDPGLVNCIGEITTIYLASEAAPARVYQHIPDAKLFVSLRNPIEQVYSWYWHLLTQNFASEDTRQLSFEAALAEYPNMLLSSARYYSHISRWLQYFDRSQLLILFYEDICSDPKLVIQKLYTFLDVDDAYCPISLRTRDISVRQGLSPRNELAGKMYAGIYNFLVRYGYRPLIDILGHEVAAQVRDQFNFKQWLRPLFYQSGYPPMASETRQVLAKVFESEIQQLAELTKRDLSHWH